MGFSHAYGAPTEKLEVVKLIRKAFDIGYDFFDAVECYTGIKVDRRLYSAEKLLVLSKYG